MDNRFFDDLYDYLYFFTVEERNNIVGEYKVIYEEKQLEGIAHREIMSEFDHPETIAKNYASELNIKYSSMRKKMSKVEGKVESFITRNEKNKEQKSFIEKFQISILRVFYFSIEILKVLVKVFLYLIILTLTLSMLSAIIGFKPREHYLELLMIGLTIYISGMSICIILISFLKRGRYGTAI